MMVSIFGTDGNSDSITEKYEVKLK